VERGGRDAVGPRTIYIIRHAEKPPDLNTSDPSVSAGQVSRGIDAWGAANDHSLTPRGWQRSGALAAWFGSADGPSRAQQLPPPTVLLAPDYGSARESAQHRTFQTIEPMSRRLGVPIRTPVAKGDEGALVGRHVLPAADADVLICWSTSTSAGSSPPSRNDSRSCQGLALASAGRTRGSTWC